MSDATPLEAVIVAVPESAGSALYGMVDVLNATGSVWQALTRTTLTTAPFRVRVVSTRREGIPLWLRHSRSAGRGN